MSSIMLATRLLLPLLISSTATPDNISSTVAQLEQVAPFADATSPALAATIHNTIRSISAVSGCVPSIRHGTVDAPAATEAPLPNTTSSISTRAEHVPHGSGSAIDAQAISTPLDTSTSGSTRSPLAAPPLSALDALSAAARAHTSSTRHEAHPLPLSALDPLAAAARALPGAPATARPANAFEVQAAAAHALRGLLEPPPARGFDTPEREDRYHLLLLTGLAAGDVALESVVRRLLGEAAAFRVEASCPPEHLEAIWGVMEGMEARCEVPQGAFAPVFMACILAVRCLSAR